MAQASAIFLSSLGAATPPSSPLPAPPNILLLGDSWAEMAGDHMSQFCKGASYTNFGIGGTMAEQWGALGGGRRCIAHDDPPCCGDWDGMGSSCRATDGLSKGNFTHAWLSVGINDYQYSDCDVRSDELSSIGVHVTGAINNIREAAPAELKIVVTGYCQPSEPICERADSPADFAAFQRSLGQAVGAFNDSSIIFVDSLGACGGSASESSSSAFMYDAYHMNCKGYCATWTMPAVQQALGCQPDSYDCSSYVCETESFSS